MKKFLLPAIAACVCVAPAFGQVYGTTPETAKPFPAAEGFVPTLEDAPAEACSQSLALRQLRLSGATHLRTIPILNRPASRYSSISATVANRHSRWQKELMPTFSHAREYLVKITPKVAGFFGMSPANPLPADRFEGKQKYYPIAVSSNEFGQTRTLEAGETKWFELTVPYATQITTNYMMSPVLAVEKIEAIHIECPGGTNLGSGLMGPYVKAGKNVIGFTASADASATFQIGYNAMLTLNCGNNLLRGQSLTLDAKTTYPDAYYTVDRYFTVPEDGTYTFINHGAKGTILNIGKVKMTDPDNQYAYECDWSDIQSATVGNDDATIVVSGLTAGEKVLVQSDAFGVIGEGSDNRPISWCVKGGSTGISDIKADNSTLKVNAANGRLNVESVLLASGAEVAVYDIMARKVASAVAAEGAESLEMSLDVTSGVYVVVVYGKGSSESAKITVK